MNISNLAYPHCGQKLRFLAVLGLGAFIFPTAPGTQAAPAYKSVGTICSLTTDSCNATYKKFAPYELPFRLPLTSKANTPFRSFDFYAVVLRRFPAGRADECDAGEWTRSVEKERLTAQRFFGLRKVFADHQCPDMGAVSYRMDGHFSSGVFIAVYGGKTRADALETLRVAKKRYPKAQLRRMSVAFERIMQ